jgi:hypothetical protein
VEEVTDEPLYRDRVCGIDIGKAEMYATIRVPSDKDPARRAQETRSFATTRGGVLALADWLRSWQVPAAAMEATAGGLQHQPLHALAHQVIHQRHDRGEGRGHLPHLLGPPPRLGLMRQPQAHHPRALGHIDRRRPADHLHRLIGHLRAGIAGHRR